jgi:hypothetical protein
MIEQKYITTGLTRCRLLSGDFIKSWHHWDGTSFVECKRATSCEFCKMSKNPSARYAFLVYDYKYKKEKFIQIPKSVFNQITLLWKRNKKPGTNITNFDIVILKEKNSDNITIYVARLLNPKLHNEHITKKIKKYKTISLTTLMENQ